MSKVASAVPDVTVFLDTNIVLEGAKVDELPWDEIASTGTIRVLIVPQVMEEIDSKKRDGRLGPIVREFNRTLWKAIDAGQPTVLREENPRVELDVAKCDAVPWDDYDELDQTDGDARIVAQALCVRDVSGPQKLVSTDMKPLAYAKRYGLDIHRASDDWLRPDELSEKDKKIETLTQELSRYRKDEPSFEIKVRVSDSAPAEVVKVEPLSDDQTEELTQLLLEKNPQKAQRRSAYPIGLDDYDSSYDDRYDKYADETVPDYVANYPDQLETMFNQRFLTVSIKNSGDVPAEHLVVNIRTTSGWLNEKIVLVSPSGPPAPQPKSRWDLYSPAIPSIHDMVRRVGRHEFETACRAARTAFTQVNCENFRVDQEYVFEGTILLSVDEPIQKVIVSITASNFRGKKVEVVAIEKNISEVSYSSLVDPVELKFTADYHVQDEVLRLLKSENFEELEWANSQDDN